MARTPEPTRPVSVRTEPARPSAAGIPPGTAASKPGARHSKLLAVYWLSGLVAPFERHPTRTIVAVGLLFALAYVTAQVWFAKPPGRVIDGDALGYYAWLRSAVFDGDINFSNDYRLLTDQFAEDSEELTPLATGLVPNKWPPGSAMLWAPLFLAVAAIVGALNLIGAQIPFDGLALPFKISAGVAGIGYAIAGVWLCYELARRIYPATAAFWATLTLWLGGPLLYYSLVSPTYSHATSLFAVALFALAWYRTRSRDDLRRFALLGALAGLAGLVRSQDLIILIVPGIELLAGIWERRWSLAAACGRLAVLGAALYRGARAPALGVAGHLRDTGAEPARRRRLLRVDATSHSSDALLHAPGPRVLGTGHTPRGSRVAVACQA